MTKPRVLLTGASGSMGNAAFLELMRRRESYDIVLLLRPTKVNRQRFGKYLLGGNRIVSRDPDQSESLRIVWGDLTDSNDVLEAVNGCDFVLHPAALISPAADHNPEMAQRVNLEGTKNILGAIKRQPNNGDEVKLVYVGSVAEYGDRLAPVYRIRTGDPLMPSVYDFYATTKIAAERAVIESGLRYWASIRQTYIAIPHALSLLDPILFHQPIDQHIELVTNEDAGFGLVQCLEAPEGFWRRVYNMGGGASCRVIYIDYIERMMAIMGLGSYRRIMDRNWFCLRNFHCGWYEDSHVLNEFLHQQRQTLNDHYRQIKEEAPAYTRLGKYLPSFTIRIVMKNMATDKNGPLHWIQSNNQGRISAFFGTKENWASIPDWDSDMPDRNVSARLLDHGYDDRKNDDELALGDLQEAAKFRGGECLSPQFLGMETKHRWRCAFGHTFEGTPTLVLRGGHWCEKCEAPPWDYDRIARKNPFLAQVYYNKHSVDESNYYGPRCFEDIL